MLDSHTLVFANARAHRIGILRASSIGLGWVVGCALMFSALSHIKNPYYYLGSVYSYGLLSERFGYFVAEVLPFLELVVAMALFGRIFLTGAMVLATLVSAVFFVAQLSALVRGLDISCGCFGTNSSFVSLKTLLLPLGLLLAVLVQFAIEILICRTPVAGDVQQQECQ